MARSQTMVSRPSRSRGRLRMVSRFALFFGAWLVLTGAKPDALIFGLLAAAGAVAEAILSAFPAIAAITVTVHKPHAPIAAIFGDVGVTMTRRRAA